MMLILEDDADDFFLMERAVRRAGVNLPLVRLTNGAQAIEYVRGEGIYSDRKKYPFPVVIVADLKMPGYNGLDFVRWLRRDSDRKSTPVIIVSSSTIPKDVEEAYALGANWFIEKPIDPANYDAFARAFRDWLTIIRLPEGR